VAVNLVHCYSYTIYIHDGISSTILSSFTCASGDWNLEGLAFDGTNLISGMRDITSGASKINIHDGVSSTISSSFSGPANNLYGLTFDGSNLISCAYDPAGGKIYIHDGVSSTILSSFSSPTIYPGGLAFDGTNLISSDYMTNGKIYIHDGVSSTILSSFSIDPDGIDGLAFDGTNLISCEGKIYMQDGVSSTILSSFSTLSSGLEVVPTAKPSTPTNLKCEGTVNPAGITDRNPELTATYSHIYGYDGRYYRVQVSRTSVGQTLPLDGSKYYWRIKFWDVNDNEGDWSTE